MPNWCSNSLKIWGSAEKMAEFYEKLDASYGDGEGRYEVGKFCMAKFHPLPDELVNTTSPAMFRPLEDGEKKEVFRDGQLFMMVIDANGMTEDEFNENQNVLVEKYGYANWYDWQNANWGTKWDVCDACEGDRTDTRYEVSYETAWSPNINFMYKFHEMFPELQATLDYYEGGCCFAGTFHIEEDGECWDEDKELGHIKLKCIDVEGEATASYHFISDDEDDDEYDEWFDVIGGEYEETLANNDIAPEDIENYDELVASFS